MSISDNLDNLQLSKTRPELRDAKLNSDINVIAYQQVGAASAAAAIDRLIERGSIRRSIHVPLLGIPGTYAVVGASLAYLYGEISLEKIALLFNCRQDVLRRLPAADRECANAISNLCAAYKRSASELSASLRTTYLDLRKREALLRYLNPDDIKGEWTKHLGEVARFYNTAQKHAWQPSALQKEGYKHGLYRGSVRPAANSEPVPFA